MRTVPTGPSDHYIRKFVEHLGDINRAESTVDTYRDILEVLDRDLAPHGIIRSNADEIKAVIASRRTPAARKTYRAAVVAFFGRACNEDDPWLDFDPTPWLPAQRVPRGRARSISTAELHDINARADEPYRTWFLLGAGEGMRAVEISRCDREDIDVSTTLIRGKGGVERTVPTHEAVWEAVRRLPRGPVARTRQGVRATRQQVDKSGNYQLQERLGYPHWTMHDLRRWYANNVHEASGGDLAVSQELLGHASPTTTRVYVDVLASKKQRAVAGLVLLGG